MNRIVPMVVLVSLLLSCGDTEDPADTSRVRDVPEELEVSLADTKEVSEPKLCDESAQLEIYEQRIEPLVSGNTINSCNQCHLSGSDLSVYARETPCKTMACLVEMGLVDFDHPEDSKILKQILKAEPQSELITAEVIDAEYQGFYEWIVYSAGCQDSVCGNISNPCAGGSGGSEWQEGTASPLGSCEEKAVLKSFEEKVFKWRSRCHGCHDNCKPSNAAPCWLVDPPKDAAPELVTAAAMTTMYNLLGIHSVNFEEPSKSSLVLKPMDEKLGGVPHGGGAKFLDIADDSYQDFQEWIEAYTSCHDGLIPQSPRVIISSPTNKKKVVEGDAISFSGYAVDPQDGLLSDAVLSWTLQPSVQPFAGGQGPHELLLEKGKYIITLSATDSDGNAGTRSIKVWIKAPPTPTPEPDADASDSTDN